MKDVAISLEIDVEVNESHATCLVPASQDTFFMKHINHAHKLTVFFLIQWHFLCLIKVVLLVVVQNFAARGLALAKIKLISLLCIVHRKKTQKIIKLFSFKHTKIFSRFFLSNNSFEPTK